MTVPLAEVTVKAFTVMSLSQQMTSYGNLTT
jgi:hypothetical protein